MAKYLYSTQAIKPAVEVKLDGCVLTEGRDYTLNYADNVTPGTGTVTVAGCGNYVGSAIRNFVIYTSPIVDVPTIPAKEYTGTAQTADVPESVLYDVTYNESHTDAGEYEVELTLTDPANYSWSGTSDDWVVVPFWIVQATNSWTTTPSITGWTYGETAHVPVAGAKFGNVKVTYGGTAADGTEISGATSVTKAGDYEAVFTVVGNRNYTGLTNRVPFSVAKAGVPGGGGGGDISVNVSGYEGLYDRQGHSITVVLSGSDAPSFTVTYALNRNGPFSAAKPMFTNVCSETVWYVLSSPDYATVTNSATVTIAKATYDMNGAQWDYAGEFPYDGNAKTVEVLGLPDGVAVASYTGNTGTLPGTYTAHVIFSYDATNYNEPALADLTWVIKSAEETTLHEIFDDLPVVIGPDGDGGWTVTLTNDITGPLNIPDNLGHLTIDLNGHDLIGPDGMLGSEITPGGNGQQAIRIVAGEGDGSVTRLSIVTTGGDSLVKGGDGGDGNPGGNGAAAIEVTGGCRDGVKIDVGAGVTVRGGKGGDSVSGNGGDGGSGIVGDVGTNDGTIIGGDGGSSDTGDGGNGGNGVDGDVDVNNGTITGGDGGDSSHGQGGDGGQGVTGDVGTNDGTISGGQGGGTTDGTPGDDGVPVGGDIGGGTGTINRARVTPPSIAPKEYTGTAQTADVPASARWNVTFNAGGTAVGLYVVALELTDSVRYRWPDVAGATIYLAFEIAKATIDVSAVGWDYSAPLSYTAYPQEILLTNLPVGVTATYTGNRATEAGTYTAHVTLNYNTDNYVAAAIPDCIWTIKPAVPFGGGNMDGLGGDTINYSGVYDGEGHGISVILRNPRPAGACVRYSHSKEGPYSDMNPVFTNVCRETVWYLVTADNYEVLTNSATVTIVPKPFTAGLVRHKGLREIKQDGSSAIVPTLVIEDEWPCQITEQDWELVAWTPKAVGGGTAVVRGRRNYTGQASVEIGNEMTVLFDAVYGTDGEALRTMTTQEPSKPYVFPSEPIYRGHEFQGWFTAKDAGEQVMPGTIVSLSDPDTLYAHWGVRTFRISFELNGGTGETEDFDAEYGSAFGELPTPKKSGYLFDGWWTTEDFQRGTRIAEGDSVPFNDTTLYAKWLRRALWYTDAVFHLEGAATYDGYLVDPAANDAIAGTIQVKAGKPGGNGTSKLTVTVLVAGEKRATFKATTFDGKVTGTVGGRALDLSLGFSSMSGTLGRYAIDGSRNVFAAKDADSKLKAAQALKQWQGTYVVAWQAARSAGAAAQGWNGLSLVVGAKGKTKAAGTLADGTKVSASAQLLVGERECALAVSWTKKSASVACLVWFREDGTVECGNLPGGASALIANSRTGSRLAAGAAFRIDSEAVAAAVPGLQADLLPDGQEVRMKGTAFDLDKAGKVALLKDKSGIDRANAGTNPSGLKLKYTVKNGTFKGTFNAYTLVGGSLKKVTVAVSGVVLGGKGYGTASVKKVGSWAVTIE